METIKNKLSPLLALVIPFYLRFNMEMKFFYFQDIYLFTSGEMSADWFRKSEIPAGTVFSGNYPIHFLPLWTFDLQGYMKVHGLRYDIATHHNDEMIIDSKEGQFEANKDPHLTILEDGTIKSTFSRFQLRNSLPLSQFLSLSVNGLDCFLMDNFKCFSRAHLEKIKWEPDLGEECWSHVKWLNKQ
jgi:hypothetical protein